MTGHIGMGLTPGQAKVLAVIKRWFSARGHAPTFRVIMRETGLPSTQNVERVLRGLEQRGHIRRTRYYPGCSRTIYLASAPPRYRFIPVSDLTWPVAA